MNYARIVLALVVLLGFLCLPPILAEDGNSGQIKMDSVGTGETRDAALIDACRLAVAKVHGTRIAGKLINHGSAGFKVATSSDHGLLDKTTGKTEVETFATSDNTSMTFDGLLPRYSVDSEQKTQDDRWSVKITADVLKTLPDRFAGRQAVVIPTVDSIEESIRKASGDTHGVGVREIASFITKGLSEAFANHPQFVILERDSEDAVNGELARAESSDAAVRERSKLQGQKTADLVLEFQSDPLVVDVQTTTFSNTPPLQKICMRFTANVRLIDVTTKGEVCRSQVEVVNDKPTITAGAVTDAVQTATTNFNHALQRSIRVMKCDMLSKLGMTNLVVTADGGLEYLGGLNGGLLETGDSVTLWKTVFNKQVRLFETTVRVEGNSIRPEISAPLTTGEVISFRMTSARSNENNSKADATKSRPPKQSLKESLGF
ncbi:MAG: hypothetical protein WCP06_01280 [Verrucomicrobiota bacterium]